MGQNEEWIDISGDGGVLKKVIEPSPDADAETPPSGDEITAHYTGTLEDGTKFDSSRDRGTPFKFILGEGNVIKAWDLGFATMKTGEHAVLKCRADYAYGENPPPSGVIKAGDTLIFDVTLESFGPKKKERWQMSAAEKLAEAKRLKDEGTKLYNEKEFHAAAARYTEAADYASDDRADTDSDAGEPGSAGAAAEEGTALFVSCHLNAAQCHLQLKQWMDAAAAATKALEKEEDNVKGLYRRSMARRHFGKLDEAKDDLLAALKKDETNKAVRKELAAVKQAIKDAKEREKSAFGGLFGRVSMYEDKDSIIVHNRNNPHVFFDMGAGDEFLGRITMELWADTCPKTAENFLRLCVGDAGKTTDGVPKTFKGSKFHRVIKNFMIQGGDFTKGDGTGGESIYGPKFADENFKIKHTEAGLLSMANSGPNTNGSQFFITCRETPHLDGKHVVFGRVVDGLPLVHKIEALPTDAQDRPLTDIVIRDCGLLPKVDLHDGTEAPPSEPTAMKSKAAEGAAEGEVNGKADSKEAESAASMEVATD